MSADGERGEMAEKAISIDTLTAVRATAMIDHYQKSYELAERRWGDRNRLLLVLLGLLPAAAFLSVVQGPLVQVLGAVSSDELAPLVGKLIGISNQDFARVAISLLLYNAALVFDMLAIFVLLAVFYLMTRFFQISEQISVDYLYVGLLEHDIRKELQFRQEVAFTREGQFYRATGAAISRLVAMSYRSALGTLLIFFFASRLFVDYPNEWVPWRLPDGGNIVNWSAALRRNLLFLLDVCLCIPTLWLFVRYSGLSSRSETDVREALVRASGTASQ
jgi:hypothetical protein